MKIKIRRLLSVLVIFIACLIFVIWAWTNIIFLVPEIKIPLEKAGITKQDAALSFIGIDIPKEKKEKFKAITGTDDDSGDIKVKDIAIYILLPTLILTAIATVIVYAITSSINQKRHRRKFIEEDNKIRINYFSKYSVPNNSFKVLCTDCISLNSNIKKQKLIIWFENNSINIINGNHRNDVGKFQVKFDDIICFSRYGDFYTSTNIKGGGTSFNRAALGYLIAGGAGAVVASRNPISSSTVVHDKRETLIIFKDNSYDKYLFFEPDFYNVLMHQIPNKEITYISSNVPKSADNYRFDKLIKLSEMKEKGYITEDEFVKLKDELINPTVTI